jgi:hypothetical protein
MRSIKVKVSENVISDDRMKMKKTEKNIKMGTDIIDLLTALSSLKSG